MTKCEFRTFLREVPTTTPRSSKSGNMIIVHITDSDSIIMPNIGRTGNLCVYGVRFRKQKIERFRMMCEFRLVIGIGQCAFRRMCTSLCIGAQEYKYDVILQRRDKEVTISSHIQHVGSAT
jgi:hypothetical protein